ncbi:unnamed protein product [Calicophoron daubneyi]|uniref:Uncharacterized protein n=1 Tax=Calicophoron daubneyi TaxID=300641 RepID=A0AAV2TSE4_CALDB
MEGTVSRLGQMDESKRISGDDDEASDTFLELVVGITVKYTLDSLIDDDLERSADPISLNINGLVRTGSDREELKRICTIDGNSLREDGKTEFESEVGDGNRVKTRIEIRTLDADLSAEDQHYCDSTGKCIVHDNRMALDVRRPGLFETIIKSVVDFSGSVLQMLFSIFSR